MKDAHVLLGSQFWRCHCWVTGAHIALDGQMLWIMVCLVSVDISVSPLGLQLSEAALKWLFSFLLHLISLMGAEEAREMIWTELEKLKIIRKCSFSSLPSHILGYETTRAVFVKWIKIHLHSHLSPSCMYLLNLV